MPQYTTKEDFPAILFSHPTLSTVECSSGIFFLICVHNYTRIKGLDSGKIASLPTRGLSPFRGDKVKMVIELDDLSSSVTYRARWLSSVFQEKKKREKMETKAIITTWSTKSKTPSRSQFVTDKKHCVAGRLMLFWYFKKYWQKNILFYPFVFDIFDARLLSVNGAWIERFNFESYSFEKNLRALFFPLESFDFIGTQSAIQCIKENIHFFASFLFVMNFAWFYANKQTAPCMSLGGFHGLMLQKKNI